MKISVVVFTYNCAHLLVDALRTLAAQTFPDFELLIVDDGSTDNTEAVVQRFSSQFRECRYLRKAHTGIADSRNVAFQAATGTHVAILEGDDMWSPRYVEAVRGVLEAAPETELVCTSGLNIYASGEVISPFFPSNLPPVRGPLRTADEFLAFYPWINVSASTIKKSAFERVGPFDTRYASGDDFDWFARAVRDGISCVRLDRRLVLYRNHGANLTTHYDRIFLSWVSAYVEIWKGHVSDPRIAAYLRNQTRKPFATLLARYPAAHNRMLLQKAIDSLDGDRLLEALYILTYLGLCPVAKASRWAKLWLRKFRPPPEKLDMEAPLDILFAKVAEEPAVERVRE
jgi:glycosyltransferase involved in cell wall biosynthesis